MFGKKKIKNLEKENKRLRVNLAYSKSDSMKYERESIKFKNQVEKLTDENNILKNEVLKYKPLYELTVDELLNVAKEYRIPVLDCFYKSDIIAEIEDERKALREMENK